MATLLPLTQILFSVSFLISWLCFPIIFKHYTNKTDWRCTTLLGLECIMFIQISRRRRRPNKTWLMISACASLFTSITCIISGISMFHSWRALVAFIPGLFWIITFLCIVYFIESCQYKSFKRALKKSKVGKMEDRYMITAQIISIVLFLFTCMFFGSWVILLSGLACTILLHVSWCLRQSNNWIIALIYVTIFTPIACIFSTIMFNVTSTWIRSTDIMLIFPAM